MATSYGNICTSFLNYQNEFDMMPSVQISFLDQERVTSIDAHSSSPGSQGSILFISRWTRQAKEGSCKTTTTAENGTQRRINKHY